MFVSYLSAKNVSTATVALLIAWNVNLLNIAGRNVGMFPEITENVYDTGKRK